LAFDKSNGYKVVQEQNRIEGPLPVCEKVFNTDYQCDFTRKSELKNKNLTQYKFHGVKIEKSNILEPIHKKYDESYKNFSEPICNIVGTEDVLKTELNGSFYLGNIISDIQNTVSNSLISIVTYGNLRTSWNPGVLPKYKIKDLLPYGNKLCTVEMNGAEVKKMMKILQGGRKPLYSTSGLTQQLVKIKDGKYFLNDVKYFDGKNEKELLSSDTYKIVAVNYHINDNGDDFSYVFRTIQKRNKNCLDEDDAKLVTDYLRQQKILDVRKFMDPKHPRVRIIQYTK
jgi:2',3'-cyclic-nucleotide 2'-phosphodiesterase (5'-nucleotidase family)